MALKSFIQRFAKPGFAQENVLATKRGPEPGTNLLPVPLCTKICHARRFSLLRAAKIIAKTKVEAEYAISRGGAMAENDAQPADHPATDYDAHEKTYRAFLQLIKYATAAAVALLVLLAFLWG